jgi:hypothetical protein
MSAGSMAGMIDISRPQGLLARNIEASGDKID